MVQVLMIFYYTFISGYSGTVLFEDWIRLSFNVICSVPILAVGCFDQDVSAKTSLDHPELYAIGRLGVDLGRLKTAWTLCAAFVHSVILFLVTILAFPSMDLHGAGDYYTFGTTAYSCLIVDVTYRAVFLTNTHNRYTVLAIVLSLFGYACWLVFYPSQQWVANLLEPNMYMVPYHMVRTAYFWFCLIAVPMLAMVVDMFVTFIYHHLFPDIRDKVFLKSGARGIMAHQEISSDGWKEERNMLCADPEQGSDGEDLSSDASSDVSDLSESDFRHLDVSELGQQKLRSVSSSFSWRVVVVVSMAAGAVITAIGVWALGVSMTTAEMRIVYTKGTQESLFFEMAHTIRPKPQATITTECRGTCTIPVTVPQDMRPPILAYYVIDPFYQNYNDYLKSEITAELQGREVSQALRENKCWSRPTRELNGRQLVPCGMKANSLFTDTFAIGGVTFDKNDTAWASDVRRYNNPPDYPTRANTSWLYQRYPTVVSEERGVKTEAFAAWMRPSAISRVWNPYGYIHTPLRKGKVLNVTINSIFDAWSLNASKLLVLTEAHTMGGHHDAFGTFLIASGLLCFVVAGITAVVRLCDGEHVSGGAGDSDSGQEE
eukprot:CAMPEP_0171212874 /NCGR_PEP_ID=MMETSP0790-20130122/30357_1 /TAXON_ID=2925 /ORGANISM="Alexandrium catenella, Strain OF101" /LENGTH=601 /DNA_ID=CAMNT_0011678571 /DNA_START=180 /DNA_END=1985 /DNA_ORIENTATION=+